MGHIDTGAPDDGTERCHMALCAGQLLGAVVAGAEVVDDATFDMHAALSAIKQPCVHHIRAAILLLDVAYLTMNWSPSRVYEVAPTIMASIWAGDVTC